MSKLMFISNSFSRFVIYSHQTDIKSKKQVIVFRLQEKSILLRIFKYPARRTKSYIGYQVQINIIPLLIYTSKRKIHCDCGTVREREIEIAAFKLHSGFKNQNAFNNYEQLKFIK